MSHSPTVLIAEDDPVFRRVMSFTISKAGLTVRAVGDGAAALESLAETEIDFLVTDHQMPRCSGIELLERAARSDQLTLPPTILCTAKGLELDGPGLRQRFGLVDILHKPFSPKKLSALILAHLSPSATEPAAGQALPSAPAATAGPPGGELAECKESRHG